MRYTLSLLVLVLLIAENTFAQSPNGINYQAVIRNAAGTVMANKAVILRFSFHETASNGAVVYQETQSTITNAYGLVNVIFGNGTITAGSFTAVNWSKKNYFLQVEINIGTGYVDMGTSQLETTPYSFYAKQAGKAVNMRLGEINDVDTTGKATGKVLKWNGASWSPQSDSSAIYTSGAGINVNGTVITNTAPDQTVTLNGSGATTVTGTYPNFTITSTPATASEWTYFNKLTFSNTAVQQDFSSLPSHDQWRLVINIQNNGAVAGDSMGLSMRLNNITPKNYSQLLMNMNGTGGEAGIDRWYIVLSLSLSDDAVSGEIIITGKAQTASAIKTFRANLTNNIFSYNALGVMGSLIGDANDVNTINIMPTHPISGTIELWYKDNK